MLDKCSTTGLLQANILVFIILRFLVLNISAGARNSAQETCQQAYGQTEQQMEVLARGLTLGEGPQLPGLNATL